MNAGRILVALLMLAAISVTSADAQLTVAEQYVFDFTMSPTPWNIEVMVPYYDPARNNGAPLEEVMVTLEGSASSEVDVEASGGDVVVMSGNVGATITASGFINGLVLDVFPSGVFAPPQQMIPNGATINLTDISGADMESIVMAGAVNVAGFVGEDDNYSVSVAAQGTSALSVSGGNMTASQRTNADARLTVQYKIVAVPEPGAAILLGMAAIGLAWLRRR